MCENKPKRNLNKHKTLTDGQDSSGQWREKKTPVRWPQSSWTFHCKHKMQMGELLVWTSKGMHEARPRLTVLAGWPRAAGKNHSALQPWSNCSFFCSSELSIKSVLHIGIVHRVTQKLIGACHAKPCFDISVPVCIWFLCIHMKNCSCIFGITYHIHLHDKREKQQTHAKQIKKKIQ